MSLSKTNSQIKHRRTFFKKLSVGLVSTSLFPALSSAKSNLSSKEVLKPPTNPDDEKYWEMVKQQFAIAPNLTMVNAANLCPSPYKVTQQIDRFAKNLEADVSFQNRGKFKAIRQQVLTELADYLGVEADEIGITRNTSEGNNIIVNGLDFKKKEEIIIWNQNHPTNGIAWVQRAKREGFKVKTIQLPANPTSEASLIAPFADAITSKTRLIAFSHISNSTGLALPAKAICQLAKEKGILTLVDGAQSFGCLAVNLKDIGCDFYTGSAHKWFMGPKETGVLYVKKSLLHRVWPSVIAAGWKEDWKTLDEKICVLGQRNDATIAALVEAMKFHQTIGPKNIENRIRQLCSYLKENIQKSIPKATFVTPLAADKSAGIVIVNLPDKAPAQIFQQLYEKHGIATAPTGGIRLSPTIYNTLEDLDKVVKALASMS